MTNLSLWANKFEPVLYFIAVSNVLKSLGFSRGGEPDIGLGLGDHAYSEHEELGGMR